MGEINIKENKMVRSYPDLNERVHNRMKYYSTVCPDIMKNFMQLYDGCMTQKTIPRKVKDLIALGIAIGIRCDGCIAFHVNDAIKSGATHDEIIDTIAVAIVMGGIPSVVYGSQALDALNEFKNYGKENWEGM